MGVSRALVWASSRTCRNTASTHRAFGEGATITAADACTVTTARWSVCHREAYGDADTAPGFLLAPPRLSGRSAGLAH